MEIRSGPLSGTGSAGALSTSATSERATATSTPIQAGQFTPTADLTNLLAAVRQVPEVRQELIGEVARRLSSGELVLPPAPEKVVGALLESGALSDS